MSTPKLYAMETKVYTNSAVNSDFVYNDTDEYQNEIAELYSYTENDEFQQNFSDFKIEMESFYLTGLEWQNLDNDMQCSFVMKIIDQLENQNDGVRMRATRCILYLAQGCWSEAKSIEQQQQMTRKNVKMLYGAGVMQSMISLLNMELDKVSHVEKGVGETDEIQVNMDDSLVLRLIFNVLYVILETIRYEQIRNNSDYYDVVEDCVNELSHPLSDGLLLHIKLLNMITKFCDGTGAHFPIKKTLLLLWKISLLTLGSTAVLRNLKNELREKFGLVAVVNDTLNVSKRMQASVVLGEEAPTPKRLGNPPKRNKALWEVICESVDVSRKQPDSVNRVRRSAWSNDDESSEIPEISEKAPKFDYAMRDTTQSASNSSLLFESKVRWRDIESFLQTARQKYFGYNLIGDNETMIGLPLPVQESVRALKRHLYVSLGEKQMEMEQRHIKNPLRAEVIELSPSEVLYQALLPNFRKYITDLLRILLAASPSAKLAAGNLNIRVIADMLPKNPSSATNVQMDVIRHKEIIVKATSAMILFYLKHFKVNHIYQFEYMAQLLAQASFIKLTLQVFAPIFTEYVSLKTRMPKREFPLCVIEQPLDEYLSEHIHTSNSVTELTYSWRNLFSCINLMRILNKIVKWKNSRILNMVSLKSTSALKDALQIRQPLFQVYVLKLLKMQARYLGRYWRRNNLKVMTAIYTKVRHRFNDDWAYSCDTVAKFWDAQEEEFDLRMRVMKFHNRRYPDLILDCELNNNCLSPNDKNCRDNKTTKEDETYNCCDKTSNGGFHSSSDRLSEQCNDYLLYSKLDLEKHVDAELSDDFKQNYEIWLENQVFGQQFDWDLV